MPRPATGLNTKTRALPDGTKEYRWYYRATGLLIGSSRSGWTKEAAIARAAEMAAERPSAPAAGSFGELCTLYKASQRFKRLSARTQAEYADHIDILRSAWEAVPVTGIPRRAVLALHARYEDRPWRANAIVRTLRLVLNFGIRKAEMPGLTVNVAAHTDLYETAPRTQIWSAVQIEAFLEESRPSLKLAFALMLYTVQRPGDVLQMTRPLVFERDGRTWIRLRQAKTDELVDVPCHANLAALIPTVTKAEALKQPLLVASPRGKPWRYRNFVRAWDTTRRRVNWKIARTAIAAAGGLPRNRKARDAAKAAIRARLLTGLQRRDLRRTGVVQMALAGATIPQIAAVAGWRIDYAQRIVDTYLPRRGEVALRGIELWENMEETVTALPSGPRRNKG